MNITKIWALTGVASVVGTTPGTLQSFSPSGDITPQAQCNGYNMNWASTSNRKYFLCFFSDASGTSYSSDCSMNSVSYSQDVAACNYYGLSDIFTYAAVCYGTVISNDDFQMDESICQYSGYSSSNCTNLVLISTTPNPTVAPTYSSAPTILPTIIPTIIPTVAPSVSPSIIPTTVPTILPTIIPTVIPTVVATHSPTLTPTFVHIGSGNNQTQTQSQDDNTEKKSMSAGEIAGIAVGVVAAAAVMGLFAHKVYKRYTEKQEINTNLLDIRDCNL